MASLAQRLVSGAVLSAICFFASTAFTLTVNTVCYRSLGPGKDLGDYGLILDNIVFFSSILALGIYDTSVQFIASYRHTAPERIVGLALGLLSILLVTTGAGAIAIQFFPTFFAETFLGAANVAALLQIAGWNLIFLSLANFFSGSLQGLEAFKTLTYATVLGNAIATPIWISLGLWLGLRGWLWGGVAQAAILSGCLGYGFFSKCRDAGFSLRRIEIMEAIRGIGQQGIPIQSNYLAQESGNWFLRWLLMTLTGDPSPLGIIRVSRTLLSFGPLLLKILGYAALPVMTELHAQVDPRQLEKATRYNLKVIGLPSVVATIGVMAALPVILRLWVGEAYVSAWPVAFILGASVTLMVLSQIARLPLVAARRNWGVLGVYIAGACALSGSYAAGLWRWGAEGMATAYLVAEVLFLLAITRLVRRKLDIAIGVAVARLLALFVAGSFLAFMVAAWTPNWAMIPFGALAAALVGAIGLMVVFDAAERRVLFDHVGQSARRTPLLRRWFADDREVANPTGPSKT